MSWQVEISEFLTHTHVARVCRNYQHGVPRLAKTFNSPQTHECRDFGGRSHDTYVMRMPAVVAPGFHQSTRLRPTRLNLRQAYIEPITYPKTQKGLIAKKT